MFNDGLWIVIDKFAKAVIKFNALNPATSFKKYVYIIVDVTGRVKVGCGSNPVKRIKDYYRKTNHQIDTVFISVPHSTAHKTEYAIIALLGMHALQSGKTEVFFMSKERLLEILKEQELDCINEVWISKNLMFNGLDLK